MVSRIVRMEAMKLVVVNFFMHFKTFIKFKISVYGSWRTNVMGDSRLTFITSNKTAINGIDYTFKRVDDNVEVLIISKVIFERPLSSLMDLSLKTFSFNFTDYNEKIKHLPIYVNRNFPNLKDYIVVGNEIKSLRKKNFVNLENLEKLALMFNKFEIIDSNSFDSLTELKTLMFYDNRIKSFDKDLFKNLHNLEVFYAVELYLTSLHPYNFMHIRNLNLIYIYSLRIEQIDENIFRDLHDLKSLKLILRCGVLEHDEKEDEKNVDLNYVKKYLI